MKIRNVVAVSSLAALKFLEIYPKRIIFLLIFLFIPCPWAFAQTLDDFRSAAGHKEEGVESIPYPTLREEARALSDKVNAGKQAVESQNPDILFKDKDNILKEIKDNTQDLEKIKKEEAEWNNKNPGSPNKPYESDIKKKESAISDAKEKLGKINERLTNVAASFGSLSTARADLRNKFTAVLSQLSDSKSNPTRHLGSTFSDEDKKSLELYIYVIEGTITLGIKTHKDQEDGAKNRKVEIEKMIEKKEI